MVEHELPPDPTSYFSSKEMDFMMSVIEEYEVEMFRLKVKSDLERMSKEQLEKTMVDLHGEDWKNL